MPSINVSGANTVDHLAITLTAATDSDVPATKDGLRMMKPIFAAVVGFLCCVTAAQAQQSIVFANLKPVGFCQLTLSTAVGLSTCAGGIPNASSSVLIIEETASSRWRDDGVAPTASVGMLLSSGASLSYQGDLTALQFIAVSGSPVLDIAFYASR